MAGTIFAFSSAPDERTFDNFLVLGGGEADVKEAPLSRQDPRCSCDAPRCSCLHGRRFLHASFGRNGRAYHVQGRAHLHLVQKARVSDHPEPSRHVFGNQRGLGQGPEGGMGAREGTRAEREGLDS